MTFSALMVMRPSQGSRPQRFFEMPRPLPSERRGLGVEEALVPAWLGVGSGVGSGLGLERGLELGFGLGTEGYCRVRDSG